MSIGRGLLAESGAGGASWGASKGRVAGELAGAPGLPQGGAFGRRRSLMKALGRLPVKEGTATRPA